ncbi:MAG: transcription antitermination factor NusB [Elusimicrobia bacterium]|nr:transcription antitermination factor NusB [Elusimicrobiota bacterium]
MGIRRQSREVALLMLYLCDICKYTDDEALYHLMHNTDLPAEGHAFARELFSGTRSNGESLDALISLHAQNWEMDRMAVVDRNILRLAAFEMTAMEDTPINVVIDEAVEIAKQFSTSESSKFVNGILDKLKTERKKTVPEKKSAHKK